MPRNRKQETSEGVREDRRRQVSSLRLRNLTVREIVRALEQNGAVNPDTREPWSIGQIGRDVKSLKDEWREEARAHTSEHAARQMAELREVRRQAWASTPIRLDTVIKALDREARLLGLDSATKILLEPPSESAIIAREKQHRDDLVNLSVDELEKLRESCEGRDEILSLARARRGAGGQQKAISGRSEPE